MIYDWKMALYWRLPTTIQEWGLSLYARHLERLYYGPGYEASVEQLRPLQFFSGPELAQWQDERLRSIVEIAATRVPYYRRKWQARDWRSVISSCALQALPCVEKQALRQNERQFLTEDVSLKSLWIEKTSGTTGTALRIYWPKSMLPQWWALVEVAIRNVAGVAQDLPRAMVGGRTIVHGNSKRPPYWRFNRRWRQLYLSSYHISKATTAEYVEALRRYGSQWITGYGSVIAALAQSALEIGLPPLKMRAVIVSGDTLLPGMRCSIEKFFDCKCYDSYGQCEAVCMAMECRQGRLHTVPAAGIWEILREDGSLCRPGEVGEIVATGLLNDAMPLIRYRVGDYAAWAEDQDCRCGNPAPIITRLEGRMDDYLFTADGKKVGRLAAFKRCPTIHSAQLVQDRPGHAYLLVRPGQNYRPADAGAVRADIFEHIGHCEIDIVEVPEIPKTPTGKTKLVIRLAEHPEMRPGYEAVLKNSDIFGKAA
jgi:phenylacetate-coenzyme A ligase PaaK-like adenylate-forming protein